MPTVDITISFSRGINADGVDAGVSVNADEDVSFVVAAGAGSVVAEGVEIKGGTGLSPDIANDEKPGVTALKYSDVLSSPILTVGKAFQ
jgi:hypothetical protein